MLAMERSGGAAAGGSGGVLAMERSGGVAGGVSGVLVMEGVVSPPHLMIAEVVGALIEMLTMKAMIIVLKAKIPINKYISCLQRNSDAALI